MNPRLKKALIVVLVSFLALLLLLLLFVWWAVSGTGDSSTLLEGEVRRTPGVDEVMLSPPDTVGVVAWNIAYGRGPAGDESGPWTKDHIRSHLDAIADSIAASGADIAALQEVDFGAARSHGIDEPEYLASRLGWPYFACVVTWQQNYVPYPYWPPSRHYGGMLSGQCVLSRYPIKSNLRMRLPQPEANPFWYNLFYLHRAIQHVVIELGDKSLHLLNVHLEAFDRPNRQEHMATLLEKIDSLDGKRLIVLGDFNALPPGETERHGFADEPEADFRGDTTMDSIWGREDLVEVLASESSRPNTFPAEAPTRRLDYLFARKDLSLQEASVMTDALVSDHRGIFARLRTGVSP